MCNIYVYNNTPATGVIIWPDENYWLDSFIHFCGIFTDEPNTHFYKELAKDGTDTDKHFV